MRPGSTPIWLTLLPSWYVGLQSICIRHSLVCCLSSQPVLVIRGTYRSSGFFFSRTNLSHFFSSPMCTESSFMHFLLAKCNGGGRRQGRRRSLGLRACLRPRRNENGSYQTSYLEYVMRDRKGLSENLAHSQSSLTKTMHKYTSLDSETERVKLCCLYLF